MRFETLQYLVDIAETNSITRTAERFFIAQQSLSSAIINLQKRLWSALDRARKRISRVC